MAAVIFPERVLLTNFEGEKALLAIQTKNHLLIIGHFPTCPFIAFNYVTACRRNLFFRQSILQFYPKIQAQSAFSQIQVCQKRIGPKSDSASRLSQNNNGTQKLSQEGKKVLGGYYKYSRRPREVVTLSIQNRKKVRNLNKRVKNNRQQLIFTYDKKCIV